MSEPSFIERRWKPRKPLTTDQLLGIANYLTYARIALVPIVVALLMGIRPERLDRASLNVFLSWMAMSFFVVAQLSDVVDGYYARKYGVGSSFGKFIDPLADKLLSTAGLVMLVELGRVSGWIAILLIAREITITGLRGIAASEGLEMAASDWGKKKTILLSVALGALMVHYPFWGIDPQRLGTIVLWVTLAVSMGSGAHYVWTFFRAVIQGQNKST
ncbi:MAG TPA: CDP-diacylglycerol--glycerol-3-phosphate 3-phosphatidyltransferase [bacterium]|nr:CDP-diacylglycerol--glycerol-3-phosphate 3-phosphatidyltransferase [bacterium]